MLHKVGRIRTFIARTCAKVGHWVGVYIIYWGIKRPLWRLWGFVLIHLKEPEVFTFRGKAYKYFYHSHGMTYLSERAVEIPIVLEAVRSRWPCRMLEIGNVLSYFVQLDHDIVDKYERAEGVLNEDVVAFRAVEPYNLIVSISTLEHVGWDETPREPRKIVFALQNLISLLAPGGELIITFPLGYNTDLDRLFREKEICFTETYFLRRLSRANSAKPKWVQADWNDVRGSRYGRRAESVVVGVLRRKLDGAIASYSQSVI